MLYAFRSDSIFVPRSSRLKGIVVGEGDTYEEALADVKSAIKFHIETSADNQALNEKNS